MNEGFGRRDKIKQIEIRRTDNTKKEAVSMRLSFFDFKMDPAGIRKSGNI